MSLTDESGREVRQLLTQPRRLALLAYLAATPPGTFHRRDTLLPLYWPELDQAHARAALRQALHALRSALGAAAIPNRGMEEVGVDPGHLWCDVSAFVSASESQRADTAIELYRGDLLEGFFIDDAPEFDEWLEAARRHLRELAKLCAMRLAEHCEAAADLVGSAFWCRQAIRFAPFDELLVRRLLGVLGRLEDHAGAAEVYADLVRRLKRDHGIAPSAATRSLLASLDAGGARQRLSVSARSAR